MIKTLAKSVREYKKTSILSPIFVSIEVILECLMPLVIMQFIGEISPSNSTSTEGVQMSTILTYGGILIAMAVLSLATGMLSGRFAARASAGFAKNLRKDMYYAIQDYSFSNIDKFSTSSLVTRQTTDVTNLQMAYMMIIRVAIRCPLMLIFSLAMAFTVNVTISWVFLALVPILAAVLVVVIIKTHPIFIRVFNKYDNMNRSVREDIKGIRVVKSFVRCSQGLYACRAYHGDKCACNAVLHLAVVFVDFFDCFAFDCEKSSESCWGRETYGIDHVCFADFVCRHAAFDGAGHDNYCADVCRTYCGSVERKEQYRIPGKCSQGS